jgi:hypothetical protein
MKKLWTALLSGCAIEPFETPSAYDGQRYLCDDPDLVELREEADKCRDEQEPPCNGYISFKGDIQRVKDLRVDTTLERSEVRVAVQQSEDTGVPPTRNLSRVELSGAAPYFHFDVAVSSIGTPWPDQPTKGVWPPLGVTDPNEALNFGDKLGAVQWYIRAGSDTALLPSAPAPNDGAIGVYYMSDERVDLKFSAELGLAGDRLEACAVAYPQGGVDFVQIQ